MKKDYLFICECGDTSHQFIVQDFGDEWIEEDGEKRLYISIHLNEDKNFFQRLFIAIKYLFGFKSKYGAFNEIILNKNQLKRLKEIC